MRSMNRSEICGAPKENNIQISPPFSFFFFQVLSQTFETASPEDTLAHFLCADDVAAVEEDEDKESERVAKETLAEEDSLLAWWENLTKRGNLSKSRSGDFPCEGSEDCVMSTDDFEELVSM